MRNFWTFIGATPVGNQKDMVLNAAEALNAINPLYISGAVDSWVTDLVWDRLMRVGPDGAAEALGGRERHLRRSDNTSNRSCAPGMKWHDGKPVTVEDVIFSFEAPAGDKSPMYKPFVAEHRQRWRRSTTRRSALQAEDAERLVLHLHARQDQPDPEARLGADPRRHLERQGKNAEAYQEPQPVGSGPFKVVRFKLQEEILLEKNPEPLGGAEDGPLDPAHRHQHRGGASACCGAASSISSPTIAATRSARRFAKQQNGASRSPPTVDMGFRFVAPQHLRRPPFDDVNFRKALSLAINRNLMAQAAWNGYAVPANSPCLGGAAGLAQGASSIKTQSRRSQEDARAGRLHAGRRQAALSGRQEGRAAGAELKG